METIDTRMGVGECWFGNFTEEDWFNWNHVQRGWGDCEKWAFIVSSLECVAVRMWLQLGLDSDH